MEATPEGPHKRARLQVSSRVVLWVGFGSLLGLMILIAVNASSAIARIESANARIRRRFLDRDELLERLRSDLYRSGIDVRDYLMHADPRLAEGRRADLQATRQEMESAIHHYRTDLAAEEQAPVNELQRDLEQYFAAIEPVLGWDAAERREKGAAFLREQVFPRREQMLEAATDIREIDTRQMESGQNTQAEVFAGFRRQLLATALVTILLGLGLAVLSISRVEKLEHESERRYREVVKAREELHRLSGRLVSAQELERRNISRELHDEVGQGMSALLVELGNLASTLPPDNAAAHEQIERVKRMAEANVGVVRNLSLLLRPSMLDDLGLVPALKWQAREVARRTGIKVKVDAEDVSDDLPDEYRTCIYRVVQEALHNATRHSQSARVLVTVRREAQRVRVTIQDDGVGFQVREKGMGILGMEERVRHLGGEFHIEARPGHGTGISILLPMAAGNGKA